MREKNNTFEISVILLRFKKCKSVLFKKGFKVVERLTKTIIFFTLEAILKMAEERNRGDVESICGRVTNPALKKVANVEVDLN